MKGDIVVCDIGSGSIKVGFAGNLSPETIIPTVVGVPMMPLEEPNTNNEKLLFGNDVVNYRPSQKLSLYYPMNEKSEIVHWDYLESLLLDAFSGIGIEGRAEFSKYKILVTKPAGTKHADLTRLFTFFIKKLGFQAATMHEQSALVLYTQGIETGIVVELGESAARIIPVYKGHAIPKLDRTMTIGGRSMSTYLMKLLRLRGYHMDAKEQGLEIGRQIKEETSYVAFDLDTEERLASETTALVQSFEFKNGSTTITVGQERFATAEILFKPSLYDSETKGLAEIIFETIQKADIDCRVELYQNIVLSGGMSRLPGIRERLQKDLNQLYNDKVLNGDISRKAPAGWKLQVHAPKSREILVFEGAALFADFIQNDRKFWASQNDFNTRGIEVLFEKCQIN